MKTLTLRIYLTVVAVLLLFALVSGWVFQLQMERERTRNEGVLSDRMAAWGELIQRSLPGIEAPPDEQAAALRDWSQRLRIPLALDNAKGERITSSDSYIRRQGDRAQRGFPVRLEDGRTLWVLRPGMGRAPGQSGTSPSASVGSSGSADGYAEMHRSERAERGDRRRTGPPGGFPLLGNLPFVPVEWQAGAGLAAGLLLLFVAVAAGAWPVVRQLTRRLQALQSGVEKFGAGALDHRVQVTGRDEVAAVATSFNQAAARIEMLVRSHQSLLANASHELRSPLARLKMAVEMMGGAAPVQQAKLKREVDTNIAELDALVEEVLLASRLDAVKNTDVFETVDLLGMAAEEAARVGAVVDVQAHAHAHAGFTVQGDERLLRRALRNLLENAKRYGGAEISVNLLHHKNATQIQVCDRGPGVSAEQRERIFEPFYRLPGHAEQAGGVGLGLSLVKQIAQRHHGSVSCEAREGGGSCFVFSLPGA